MTLNVFKWILEDVNKASNWMNANDSERRAGRTLLSRYETPRVTELQQKLHSVHCYKSIAKAFYLTLPNIGHNLARKKNMCYLE